MLRGEFPRDLHWLLRPVRQFVRDADISKKFNKEMSIIMMNIGNLYNCVDEVYTCFHYKDAVRLPIEFMDDFRVLIGRCYREGYKLVRYLPEKFVIKSSQEVSILPVNSLKNMYFSIIRIRPEAISYLKQKHPERFEKMIRVLELMGKQHDENIDFDKYIDEWARRLLYEDTKP